VHALDDAGVVYGFGETDTGALSTLALRIAHRIDITGAPKIVDIYAGHDHVLYVTETGQLYSFGLNDASQSLSRFGTVLASASDALRDGAFTGTPAESREMALFALGKKAGFSVSSFVTYCFPLLRFSLRLRLQNMMRHRFVFFFSFLCFPILQSLS
jgi:hypothetical protein